MNWLRGRRGFLHLPVTILTLPNMKSCLALILVCLVASTHGAATVGGSESVEELCRRAQELLDAGKYQLAREAAEHALGINSGSAEAEDLAGTAALALDDLRGAEAHLRRALELTPERIDARKSLGATYLKERRLTDARREFLLVLEARPQDFDSHYNLGRALLLSDQPEAALGQFENAARLKPGGSALLADTLDAQLRLKRADQAAVTLAALDRQLGERDTLRVHIAELLVRQGAYSLAAREFERLHKADPKSYEFSYNLALAYHRAGNDAQASTFLQSLLVRNDSAELEDLLGEVEESRGASASSLAAFRRAAELDPKSEDYRLHYGQALVNQGALNEAVRVFAEATKDLPQSSQMWMAWGGTLYLLGRFTDSAQKLLRAAEIAPNDPRVYFLLGRAYDAAGPLRDTITRQFAHHLLETPNDAWAQYFYGRILAERIIQGSPGDLDEAQQHVEKALALDGSLAEAHAELGSILDARGQIDAARRELEQATRLDASSSIAYYRLAHVYQELGQNEQARAAIEKFQELKKEKARHRD